MPLLGIFTETNTAQSEISHVASFASAQRATTHDTGAKFRFLPALRFLCFCCHKECKYGLGSRRLLGRVLLLFALPA